MTKIKMRPLGKSGLEVSEIGFGAASIGNLYSETTDEQTREVMKACWGMGIRFYDTAPEYGHGLSERRLGDNLRQHRHDQYILSTKVGDLLYAKHDKLPAENKFINKLNFHLKHDYSFDGIMRCFEDSLQRLGLNTIDVLLVHDLDPVIHSKEAFERHFHDLEHGGFKALSELRESGAVKAIGFGVKQWEVCERALEHGDYDCFMLQGNYTLLEQPALETFLPRCEKEQIAIFLAGPFASGILATGPVKGANFHHQAAPDEILNRVKKMQTICQDFNVPLAAAAIQFPLMHPAISSVVIGSRSAERMQQNLEYYHVTIPDDLWQQLKAEKIIPQDAPTT